MVGRHQQPIRAHLAHPAPVPVGQGLGGAVAAPQPRPLRQDVLQLGRGAAGDQRPDQGQGVLVEVGLKQKTCSLVTPPPDICNLKLTS